MRPTRIRTAIPGPRSQELARTQSRFVSGAVSTAHPVFIDRGQGSILTDVDGNEFLDFGSGIGVIALGHGHPRATGAAVEQLGRFSHTLFTVTPYELYVEVSRRLTELTPGDFEKKSVLSTSGAEAIENAMKIARGYTGRNGIAVVDHGYHGRTNLALGLNYKAGVYSAGAGPRPGEIYRTNNSHPYRDGMTGKEAAEKAIDYLEMTSGAKNLACLLIEPIQGEGGVVIPADGYLPTLQQWARENGIVVVADEIQTGLGRTGRMFGSEHFGFEPDVVVTAKAIAAGIPVSAVTGRAEVMDGLEPGALSGTYSGNPVGCAAALEVFAELTRPGFLEHTAGIGEQIQAGLRELQKEFPVIGDVRGLGALHGIELVHSDGTPHPGAHAELRRLALERGMVALPGGSEGHVLRFLPALNIPAELVSEGLEILGEALAAMGAR